MKKYLSIKTVCLLLLFILVAAIALTAKTPSADTQSQTFFHQFIIAGGPIVWFILLPMSLIMVYLAVEYSITISSKKLLPTGLAETLKNSIRNGGTKELTSQLNTNSDLLSTALASSLKKAKTDWFRVPHLINESLQEQAMYLLRKIEWINLIGNVSPMVGLFGTVFGMIKLFNTIVLAKGKPEPAALAGGISVALVTTFWGLFIAIPALTIYGIFRNKIESLVSDALTESDKVTPLIRSSLQKQQVTRQKTEIKPPERS